MNEKPLSFVHLRRKSGVPLILYEFDQKSVKLKDLEGRGWQGWYGSEPRSETVGLIRQTLYDIAEKTLLKWDSEKKFLTRFLWSTAVFMLVYFITTYAIRDPLPVIDELIQAAIGAVVTYYLMRKSGAKAEEVAKIRIALRENIDRTRLDYDSFAEAWENELQRLEDWPSEGLFDLIRDSGGEVRQENSAVNPFVHLYKFHLGDLKDLLHRHRKSDAPLLRQALSGFMKHRKIDLPLLALALKKPARINSDG